MERTVCFRDFEERDIDFIYKCKNDEKLNSMIVGQWHPFTYEEAAKWVHGCMGSHDTFKLWAVCTNDKEQRIVGWIGVSQIDYINNSACFHSIVIADTEYQDGMAWIESFLFVMNYIFEEKKLHRMYGTALTEHEASITIGEAMFERIEGVFRDAVYKNGRYYDLAYCGILANEYFEHKQNGASDLLSIIRRIGKIRKQKRTNK